MINFKPLEELRIADPDTFAWVKERLHRMQPPPAEALLKQLAGETLWALSQEQGLARTVAEGLTSLMARGKADLVPTYIGRVREAARTGPTLAQLLARHLVPVLTAGGAFLERFSAVVNVLRSKGTYTLRETLQVLADLLESGDTASARAYLELLEATFGQALTYNHSVRLVYQLPRAVRAFGPRRRTAQIKAFIGVVRADLGLVDPFLDGIQQGLAFLKPHELEHFVGQALQRWRSSAKSGAAFIALSSEEGRQACAQLQAAVPLAAIKAALERYLNARLSRAVALKPISGIAPADPETPWICSDGQFIYLNEELDRYPQSGRNRMLGKLLVRLEASRFEYGSFSFDLERAADLYSEVAQRSAAVLKEPERSDFGDARRFFACFDRPELAEDLFDLFEQARLLRRTARHYPGLVQQALALLREEAGVLQKAARWDHPLAPLYARLALALPPAAEVCGPARMLAEKGAQLFDRMLAVDSPVEACARMVCLTYPLAARAHSETPGTAPRLRPPFGRRLRWDLVQAVLMRQSAAAWRIKIRLAEHGLKVYRTDLLHRLDQHNGRLSGDDLQNLVLGAVQSTGLDGSVAAGLSGLDPSTLLDIVDAAQPGPAEIAGAAFYYPEWDDQLHDYLREHARVQESVVAPAGEAAFYGETLDRHRGMVARMRRAFEFLKPEGLVLLRQWPEGDDFDYRALIDHALDVRAGRIPSDRLYMKRLKQQREVAVLLLVDLSRSTANPAVGGNSTVLGVAKEALVLFCEALQVVGDRYAVAGFSGTGRHCVDYFRIKDFEEPLGQTVRQRVSALTPQRSTRMGAAIRHATRRLAAVASRVRLLILVSDGFPNDLGYKAGHAIADTRKAVQEARACRMHVKAITVQVGSDPRLDDLYGRHHHRVIADVRDLPDKLLRLYGTLTKSI